MFRATRVVPVDVLSPGWLLVVVVAVLFLASFIRSAFGFGEALVAVPLLALIMPVEMAVPVAVLVSITVAAIVLAQDWREVHVRSAGRLLVPTVVGTPLGLLLLTQVDGFIVKSILALVILAFSIRALTGRRPWTLRGERWAWLFGFIAGVLGGAYGMNGPPLVVYGAARGWSPQHFRATLQAYFLPASILAMAGYALAGLWTPAVTRYFLTTLPVILVATLLGRLVNRRLSGEVFLRYVYLGLILTSLVLLLQALG